MKLNPETRFVGGKGRINMSRITRDQWAMKLAVVTAERSTCVRRQVGCILLNERGHVIATGYNGVAAGLEHCIDNPCPGARMKSGTGLDDCQAIHAEQNALLQCRNVYEIDVAYVTASPCVTCTKLLLNTSCKRVVYLEEYPHAQSSSIWTKTGRIWEKIDLFLEN